MPVMPGPTRRDAKIPYGTWNSPCIRLVPDRPMRPLSRRKEAPRRIILPRMTICGKCPEFFTKHEARQYIIELPRGAPEFFSRLLPGR